MAISFATAPGRERQREREKDDDSVLEWEKAGNEERQFQKRERIRKECRAALLECAHNSRTAMTVADVQEYYRMGLSEESLTFAQTEEEKTRELLKYRNEYVPIFIRKAEEAGAKALALIDEAQRHHWITQESAERWRGRLKNEKSWLEKQGFIEQQLSDFVQNWRKVREDTVDAAKKAKELGLTENDWQTMPELAELKKHGFWDQKYPVSRGAVDKALAFLAVLRKERQEGKESANLKGLYALAEGKLKKAARDGVLAEWKVGTWLKRIFGSNAKKELIEKFVSGGPDEGKATLSGLIRNWSQVRTQFDDIEKERGKKETPRNFHFVHLDVFLGWDFEQRKAYVRQARQRIEYIDISKQREIILKIRHELCERDWDEAEALLKEAWHEKDLTDQERKQLTELEQELKELSKGARRFEKTESPSPLEIYAKMHQALRAISSPSVRRRYELAMKYDYQTAWAYMTEVYNWKWCRLHGYSNDKIDEQHRRKAKANTYRYLKDGHPRSGVNVDMTSDTSKKPAARSDNDTSSPQVINVDASTDNAALIRFVHENKDNKAVWYWSRIVAEDYPYPQTEYCIDRLHPILKWGMRQLKAKNLPFMTEAELLGKTEENLAMAA